MVGMKKLFTSRADGDGAITLIEVLAVVATIGVLLMTLLR